MVNSGFRISIMFMDDYNIENNTGIYVRKISLI